MNRYSFLFFTILIFSTSCHDRQVKKISKAKERTLYSYLDSSYLVQKKYDSNGILRFEKWYTLDTIIHGAEIWYYNNGNIKKWEWYNKGQQYPWGIVYYDTDGYFNSFKGNALLRAVHLDDGTGIETINPPNVAFRLGYKDYRNGHLNDKKLYYLGYTDTTAWAKLVHFKPKKGHKYMLQFYFVDTIKHRYLDSVNEARELNTKPHK